MKGLEPSQEAWKAAVLPLHHIRINILLLYLTPIPALILDCATASIAIGTL